MSSVLPRDRWGGGGGVRSRAKFYSRLLSVRFENGHVKTVQTFNVFSANVNSGALRFSLCLLWSTFFH